MARTFHPSRLIALAALAAVVLAWFLPRPVPAQGSDSAWTHHAFQGGGIGGAAVPAFVYKIDRSTTQKQTGSPYTSVCADNAAYGFELWGTYVDGDTFTGTVASEPAPVTSSYWYVPIIGYPSRPGNRLLVEAVGANGAIKRITYHGANPGEALALWRVDLRGMLGGTARVVMEDGTTTATGWVGAGIPVAAEDPAATLQKFLEGPTNYVRYWLTGLVLAALIFIPGLALRRLRPDHFGLEIALLPIPGLMVLAAYGVLLWVLDAGHNGLARHVLLIIEGLLAGWSALSPTRSDVRPSSGPDDRRGESALGTTRSTLVDPAASISIGTKTYSHHWIWAIYLGVAALAAGYGIVRRPVTQEFYRGTTFQSRMVTSPPDSIIPYVTAVYFHAGYDGQPKSDDYFSPSANVATRGPLSPYIMNAAFNLLRLRPSDPPNPTTDVWPAAADGYYASRWIAVLTNACAIAGVGALTLALGGRFWFAVLWAAVAPITFTNVSFTWPKLFAAYFVLLALADVLRSKPAYRWGIWLALGYLAHPVGGLFALPVLFYALRTRGFKPTFVGGLAASLCILPWLAYKHSLGAVDSFWRYPLGDGRGYLDGLGVSSWLLSRWHNLWYTVVPGAYFFSSQMQVWLWGPVSQPTRWAEQYAKTLPSNLGYYGALLAYFALIRLAWAKGRALTTPVVKQFALWYLLPALTILLLYWGFSDDGLGRACLEPLSMGVLAWSAAAYSPKLRPSALMIGFVAIETMTMVVFSFL